MIISGSGCTLFFSMFLMQELMGRPISLKLSEKNADAFENKMEETNEESKEA